MFDKYDIASLTMPDFVQANMKASIPAVHAEIQHIAKLILEKNRPRGYSELDLTLTSLEIEVEMAMRPPSMRRESSSAPAAKGQMETRRFGEDWGQPMTYVPSRQQQQERLRPLNEQPTDPNPYDGNPGYDTGWPPRLKP